MNGGQDAAFEPAKLAPHSQDGEENTLGSILINPHAYWDVAGLLKVGDFFILRNDWVWEAMVRLAERGDPVEYLTVIEELRAQERLDDVGGAAYITYLASNIGTSVHAEAYGRIVLRAAIRRRMLEAASEITRLAREEDAEISKVTDKAEAALWKVTQRAINEPLAPDGDSLVALFDEIGALAKGEFEPYVVKTYTKLDSYLTGGGMEPGAWIVSSDTSGGKSLFKLNLMLNAALDGLNTALFTMEMTRKSVYRRMLARVSSITTDKLALGKIDDAKLKDYERAQSTLLRVSDRLLIDDTMSISIYQIMSKIRRAVRDYGIRIVFVDYVGLIDAEETNDDKRYKIVGSFIRKLHGLALDWGVVIVVGAQQNRQGGGVKGVAESYEIAQHSQGFFYIADAEGQQELAGTVKEKVITIAKQRDGWSGKPVNFEFDLGCQAMKNKGDDSELEMQWWQK